LQAFLGCYFNRSLQPMNRAAVSAIRPITSFSLLFMLRCLLRLSARSQVRSGTSPAGLSAPSQPGVIGEPTRRCRNFLTVALWT
jgi:hypothetical protein